MRKLNIEVEAVVKLSVKVKLGLLVRADDDASVDRIVKQFVKGQPADEQGRRGGRADRGRRVR